MGNDARPHAIVIGSGSGGLTVAVGLGRLGKAAILIEAAEIGGDCTNVGCIPSKSLLHLSADAGHSPGEAFKRVRQRRDALRQHEEQEFGRAPGVEFRRGRGRIVAADTVEITQADGSIQWVSAPNVVIATGSRPRRLPIPGLAPDRILTNEEVFELAEPPGHLLIVGAGAVGVELATAFARLGSKVTLVEYESRILGTMLPEAAAIVRAALERLGVRIETGARVAAYEHGAVSLESVSGSSVVGAAAEVDAVLLAAGRVPNSDDLGLETVGVERDDNGRIIIDEYGRTSVRGIWACGDVTTEGGTTHAAGAWGRRVLRAMVAPRLGFPDPPPMPAAVFTDPEAATIGSQPAEVPDDVRRIRVEIPSIDRAYTDEVEHGVLVIDVQRLTGRILGCTIVGPRAGELIGTVSLAMNAGVRFQLLSRTVWPYPTYTDSLAAAADVYLLESLSAIPADAWRWLKGKLRHARR